MTALLFRHIKMVTKTYEIQGYSDRKFFAYVKANSKKEALEMANRGEWADEQTESEDFHDIEII